MRRTNTGAARHLVVARPGRGPGAVEPIVRQTPEPGLASRAPLSRITVLSVVLGQSSPEERDRRDNAALIRIIDSIPARSVSPRVLEGSGADVVLLDARASRPTLAYRAIAKLRNA